MRYVLTRAATIELEDAAENAGCPRAQLMQRAGRAVARIAEGMAPDGRIVVLAGSGNNGGDGWVAAADLFARGRDVEVLAAKAPDDLREIAADAARRAIDAGVPHRVLPTSDELHASLEGAALVIDGLLGTGFFGELRAPYDIWCPAVNQAHVPVLSIDVPSGMSPDTGEAAWGAVMATKTMACIAIKPGMVAGVGGEQCGEVLVDDLGCRELLGDDAFADRCTAELWDDDEFAAIVPRAQAAANKYSRGTLLVVAGSSAFTGAALLSSLGGSRAGAGYVTLAAPEPIVPILQGQLMSIPVRALDARGGTLDPHAASQAIELSAKARACVIGPGLSRTRGTQEVVKAMVQKCTVPLLVDADGLSIISGLADVAVDRAEAKLPLILTPHAGELRKLAEAAGVDCSAIPERATDAVQPPCEFTKIAVQVARAYGATVIAKGPLSVVTNGARTVFSADGSPALATAGTGDVLSGVVGGLLAQGLSPMNAAMLGLRLGGFAARKASTYRSDIGVMAEDVLEHIGDAVNLTRQGAAR